MERMLGKKTHIAIFVLPALLLFVTFGLIPLVTSGIYSLFEYDGIGTMRFIGLNNYVRMLRDDPNFIRAIVNSLILVSASLFIQLPISLGLAMLLARGVRGEKYFRTIYFIPVVISSMVIGQLWMKIFNSEYGLLNMLITTVTGRTFDYSWLSNPQTAFLSTVVPAVWQYIGYHMLIFYAGIKSIPKDYYEAAMIDGATKWQTNMKITIPLLAPVIKTCSIFAITGSLRAFDLIYVMTGGGPNNASHVPATLMYNNLFRRGLYGYGSAQAFFIVLECLIFSYIVARLFRKAEENASVL